jgi:hypothetical protein
MRRYIKLDFKYDLFSYKIRRIRITCLFLMDQGDHAVTLCILVLLLSWYYVQKYNNINIIFLNCPYTINAIIIVVIIGVAGLSS